MKRACRRIIPALSLSLLALTAGTYETKAQVQVLVNGLNPQQQISRHIYGHFSEHLGRCIYDGFWVSEDMKVPKKDRIRLDIVDALKKINIPNLRWPGGCFADEYHWRDGIGPRSQRPKMVNTNWGGVTEDNSFGTHEFLELCNLLNCEPYVAGNVGSGTVEEMSKWIEYLNFDGQSPMTELRKQNGRSAPWKVAFWGVGNESWGCGGEMTPDYYSDQYRRYSSFAKNYPGAPLKKIASGANVDDYNWTETCMRKIGPRNMWGITLHHYTLSGGWYDKGPATGFDEGRYFGAMKSCQFMETLINRHGAIMDKYDPEKRVALVVDEWGIWTNVEPGSNPGFLFQQNSMRDAIIAANTLNIFNNHSDRVRMACLAQTINVLQALILTEKEKLLLTPTYHVFDMYKVHQDAMLLPVQFKSPEYTRGKDKVEAISISASKDSTGKVHITLANVNPSVKTDVALQLAGYKFTAVEGRILTSGSFADVNSFEQPDKIKPVAFKGASVAGSTVNVQLPPLSVVVLELK